MIIYGSRMYFKKDVVKSFEECDHCGVYGKMTSYKARKFGHIYFIPLIPMGASSQVLRECKRCQMGAHIPLDQLEPMVDSVADQFKSLIMAVSEGETEIELEPDTPPANIGVMIAGIMGDLYCLKEIENADSISDVMLANNLNYENEIVQGRWSELTGKLDEAKAHYQAAHRQKPDDSIPIYQTAMTELRLKQLDAAEAEFNKYLEMVPDDIGTHAIVADIYQKQKKFDKVVGAYDEIYRLSPENLENKAMKKIYKKACKKSGIQGEFLAQL